MRTAIVQMSAGQDAAANVEAVGRLTADAVREHPDLVVLPEAVMFDFGAAGSPVADAAEALDGLFVTTLHDLAAEHGTTVVAGMFERSADPARPYNTLVAVDGSGVLAAYRKAHLYDAFGERESDRLLAGDLTATTFEAGGLRVGLMTCYDLRFPESARVLVDAGADVLAVPAAWVRGPRKEEHWEVLLRARAVESTAYVVAAAQCGRTYCGRSAVLDPLGVSLAALGEAEGTAIATLTRERIDEVRRRNPSLANRRYRVVPR